MRLLIDCGLEIINFHVHYTKCPGNCQLIPYKNMDSFRAKARALRPECPRGASAHIFLGAVVLHPDTHFAFWQEILLDADLVIGRADPGSGVQAQVLCHARLMAFAVHKNHLTASMHLRRTVQTEKLLSKVPYFSGGSPVDMRFSEKIPGKKVDFQPSIDFLPKRIYTNKTQHTLTEDP